MNICIYGASSTETGKNYIDEVFNFSKKLAERGHGLVFGAGANGLMGAAARGFTAGGGNIIGIAPKFFSADGLIYDKCTELIRTETMRERKQIMEDKSDAFVIAPGGIGTYDEFFEMLTLKQLGRHRKCMVIYNIDGFYDSLSELMKRAIKDNFIREKTMSLCRVENDADKIIDYIENYTESDYSMSDMKFVKE